MDGGDIMTINGNCITAADGKVLQKGDITAVTVYLGVNDSAENWAEIDAPEEQITDSEALEIITGGDSA
ncbi:hypothetical protein [Alistipes putredinis]|uniref:hypothetical protein n=1 Tax=Bacteroidales TaxID=171549 RepID=UPI003AAAF7DB